MRDVSKIAEIFKRLTALETQRRRDLKLQMEIDDEFKAKIAKLEEALKYFGQSNPNLQKPTCKTCAGNCWIANLQTRTGDGGLVPCPDCAKKCTFPECDCNDGGKWNSPKDCPKCAPNTGCADLLFCSPCQVEFPVGALCPKCGHKKGCQSHEGRFNHFCQLCINLNADPQPERTLKAKLEECFLENTCIVGDKLLSKFAQIAEEHSRPLMYKKYAEGYNSALKQYQSERNRMRESVTEELRDKFDSFTIGKATLIEVFRALRSELFPNKEK